MLVRQTWPFAALVVAFVGPLADSAYPQTDPPMGDERRAADSDTRLKGQVTSLAVNALLGGLTGGIGQRARGESFSNGFSLGAAGGAVIYVGKRISGERFRGAGTLGRQASAVGSSLVANSAASRAPFERLVFPVGMTRLYWNRGNPKSVRLRVDAPATVLTLYYALGSNTALDGRRSMSAGAPVFVARTFSLSAGRHSVGVIRLRADKRATMNRALAHEQIHVLQTDFAFVTWSEPAERWLFSRTGIGESLGRYFDFRLDALLLEGVNRMIPYSERPWEREAHLLSRTTEPIPAREMTLSHQESARSSAPARREPLIKRKDAP